MGPGRIVGSQRVYVHLEEPFSYAGWVKNLKQGHTFVTNGPMLFLNVDGKPIGEILEITGSSRTTVKVFLFSGWKSFRMAKWCAGFLLYHPTICVPRSPWMSLLLIVGGLRQGV
jgi:hypothetical protein